MPWNNDYFGAGMGGMPTNVGPYAQNYVYNTSPIANRKTFGPVDQMLMMMMGRKLYPLPQPGSNQSIYDAYWRRTRDMELLQVRNNAVANMLPFKKMGGLNQDSMFFQIGSAMANHPDGPFAKMMSPLIGGNPIQSQMSMYANMRGLNMSTFGTTMDVTGKDVGRLQDILYGKFYNQRTIGETDLQDSKTALLRSARRRGASDDLLKRAEGIFAKDGTLNQSQYDNFKKDAASVKGVEQALAEAKLDTAEGRRKAKEAADTFIKNITDPEAKKKIKDAMGDAIKQGDIEVFRKMSGSRSIETVANQLELHSALKLNDKLPTSINFANSYGFAMEDITSAFTGAASMKLLGNKRDIFGTMSKFAGGENVASLDAARSLFGSGKTGKELMGNINEFLGVSTVDFANTAQSNKFQDLARDLKSLSRNLNISVEASVEFINQAKNYASNTRGLQFMGGMEVGKMVVNAGHQLAAVTSVMDAASVRRMGGTQGLMQTLVGGQLENASEPITQQLAALHTYFKNRPEFQKAVRDFADRGDKSQMGYNTFLNNLAGSSGANYYDMMTYANNNEMASNIGLADAPGLANAGSKAKIQQLRQAAFFQHGGGAVGQAALNSIDRALSTKGVDLDAYIGKADQDVDKGSQGIAERIKAMLGADDLKKVGITSIDDFMNATPEIKNSHGALASAINTLDARMQQRVGDVRDVNGNLVRQGRDATLEGMGVVGNFKKLQPDMLAASPYLNTGMLNNMVQDVVKSGAALTYATENDPGTRAQLEASRRRADEDKAIEKKLAKGLAFLNAPTSTAMFQKILSGDLAKNGITDLLAPLGLDSQSNDYKRLVEHGKSLVDVTSSATYADLSRALRARGVNMSEEDMKGMSDLSKKYNITGSKLKDLASAKDAKEAMNIINQGRDKKSQIGDAKEAQQLLVYAKQARNLGITDNYSGQISFESLRSHFGAKELEKYRDEIAAPQLADINTLMTNKLEDAAKGVSVDPDQKKIALALKDANVKSTDQLQKLMEGSGMDKDGKINSDLSALAKKMGISGDKDSDIVSSVRDKIAKLDITKYADEAAGVKAQAKDAGKTDGQILAEINGKMGSIPDMLQEVAAAITRLGNLTS
jgi:hypothetical protein